MGLGWSSAEERQPLLPPPPPQQQQRRRPQPGGPAGGPAVPAAVPVRRLAPLSGRVYGRRWLVLLLFSLLGFAQGLVWNTWGPIQNSARLAFGFSGWDIALLVFWGPIGFAPCFFFMWLMDKKDVFLYITALHATPVLFALFTHFFEAVVVVPGQLFETPHTEEYQETAYWI
ncbi:disrupted in renal carcinoma protein 2 [Limosa lapponica baueri]|uniref:Disrupted in renal carcinoma protein 2 n=1 Tax=Limosa lapponica baueri TaxID=1758121 RepID=A0A2I0U2L1_LIMLA|nr:disrupted in renal carcinoma protein 2 [Limosa lapponica baueri]